MKKFSLIVSILFTLQNAAVAFAEFSINEVAEDNVITDAKKYQSFQATLNKFEPKKTIWVLREPGLTSGDVEAAYEDHIDTVENPFAVPLKVIESQPAIKIKFKEKLKNEKFTAKNVNKIVAIILDGEILAAPKIYEPITDGSVVINGNWTQQDVARIVKRINEIVQLKK